VKTLFVRTIIVLVLVNAAAGILALLAGDFSEFEGRVLLTTLSITAGSILLLACVSAAEARVAHPLGAIGAVAVVLGFGLLVAGIWVDFDVEGDQSETFWRTTGSAVTVAVCLSYLCLISLPRLAERFSFVRAAAYVFASLVAIEVLIAIWHEEFGLGNQGLEDVFWRDLGVSAILLSAATILLPLLPRTDQRGAPRHATHPIAFCPSCGTLVSTSSEEVACLNCGGRFRVTTLAVD
jgi:hypothetical protein